MLTLLWVSPAEAQVNCAGLSATPCDMATSQYSLLQAFQGLPSSQAGQNALQTDLSTVVSIYNNATVAQRAQAVQNSNDVVASYNGNINSYNPTAQYNVWQQISSSSQILSTLGAFPQLSMSSALAGRLSDLLYTDISDYENRRTTSPTISAVTQLLQGHYTSPAPGSTSPDLVSDGSITGVQMVGQLKDAFTAYSIYFPYSNPANRTSYSLPPCVGNGCQPDPRPYQLTTQISAWQSGQASSSDISSQASQWNENMTSGAFPSGHSTYGNTTALLYAIMFPQAYQSLMVSGQQFGLSRNILGVHHTLDIIGGRMLAYYTMTQLLSGNYTLSAADVPTFAGVPAYTDFATYVSQLASILQGQMSSVAAVPYASCAANVASCMSTGVVPTAVQFAAADQAYEAQATYGLPLVSTPNLPGVVPANAELLLTTRFPYLSNAEIIEVRRSTELPSGGPLDDGTGWARLNLFKAAGGYGAFDSSVSVTLDATLGGFNAVDMWSNDISGPGGLTKGGSGLLILGGTNSYLGGTTVIEGTLALTGSMVGNLDIRTGATFVSSGGYTVAPGALLTNAGTFQSVNSSLVNNGTIDNSGQILGSVTNNGVFNQMNGAFANGSNSAFVNNATFTGDLINSGYLGGTGTFTGSVVNNGVVAPGNSIGTLNVSGSYTQSEGSSYLVEVNAAGQSDRIDVSGAPGTATINGGAVVAAATSGAVYAPSTTYTILNATGGVTGSYSGVSSLLPFLQSSLSYDANNVYLTLKPGGFARGGQTSNQIAVGGALDRNVASASGDFATVVGTMASYTLQQGQAALVTLSGENYSGFGTANLGGALLFMNALGQQMALGRGAPSAGKDSRIALVEACDVACDGEPASTWSLWATALGGTGTVAGTAGSTTLTYNAGGAAAGFDYRFDPRFMAGLAIGFSSGNQWASGFGGQGTANAYQASLYASFTPGAFYIDAMAGYGYNDNQMTRQIVLPNLASRVAQGRTGANQFLGQVETGYRIGLYPPAAVSVTPFARFQGTTINQQAFTESGAGALNLAVAQQTTGSARSVLGAEFAGAFGAEGREKLAAQLRLGWVHEFASTARPVTASFAGAPGSNFTVFGAAPTTDTATLSLAADTEIADGVDLYLRYDGEIGYGISSHALSGGLRATW